jgi:hypothetical protein
MKPLRLIAATLAAALCALGLSVGAAMAEDATHAAGSAPAKASKSAPALLCDLHDVAR